MTVIFCFSHPIIRQKAYEYFWKTHRLYILLYALTLVHGLARITGSPRFWTFFIGPAVVFAFDKVSTIIVMIECIFDHILISHFLNQQYLYQKFAEIQQKI